MKRSDIFRVLPLTLVIITSFFNQKTFAGKDYQQSEAINATFLFEPIACHGGTTDLTIIATGGSGSFLYSNDGKKFSDIPEFKNVSSGNHTFWITDGSTDTLVSEILIGEPNALTMALSVTAATCSDPVNGSTSDGTIRGRISGGVAPYSVFLYTGCNELSTKEASAEKSQGVLYWGLKPGWYNVMVVDANGCTASECIEVMAHEISLKYIAEPVCTNVAGSPSHLVDIKTFVKHPAAHSFGYLWQNGSVKPNPSWLEPGIYTLIVTAFNPFGEAICSKIFTIDATAECLNPPVAVDPEEPGEPADDSGEELSTPTFDLSTSETEAFLKVYPNPLNGAGIIEFMSNHSESTMITMYNSTGERISVFYQGKPMPFETYTTHFQTDQLANGIYLLVMRGASHSSTVRVLVQN